MESREEVASAIICLTNERDLHESAGHWSVAIRFNNRISKLKGILKALINKSEPTETERMIFPELSEVNNG